VMIRDYVRTLFEFAATLHPEAISGRRRSDCASFRRGSHARGHRQGV
jgi:hypothetical protein